MEVSTSLTETVEFSAEKLLHNLIKLHELVNGQHEHAAHNRSPNTIFCYIGYPYKMHSVLNIIIQISFRMLKFSVQYSGIAENQEAIESWILDLLREIYRTNPKAFTKDIIEGLMSLSKRTKERQQILPIGCPLKEGLRYISEYGIQSIGREGRHPFTVGSGGTTTITDISRYLEQHVTLLSPIVAVYKEVSTEIIPSEAAHLFLNEVNKHQERVDIERVQKVRESFSSLRKEKNLPEAELREANHKRHRVTHCYSCRCGLETGLYLECSVCNWLVCECGACGCGYSGAKPANRDMEYDGNENTGYDDSHVEENDDDNESKLLSEELSEENRLFAKSKDDGWFYDDEDENNQASRIDY